MTTEPSTEVSTGRLRRDPEGKCGVRVLYASVYPIKIDRGIIMKRSM